MKWPHLPRDEGGPLWGLLLALGVAAVCVLVILRWLVP